MTVNISSNVLDDISHKKVGLHLINPEGLCRYRHITAISASIGVIAYVRQLFQLRLELSNMYDSYFSFDWGYRICTTAISASIGAIGYVRQLFQLRLELSDMYDSYFSFDWGHRICTTAISASIGAIGYVRQLFGIGLGVSDMSGDFNNITSQSHSS